MESFESFVNGAPLRGDDAIAHDLAHPATGSIWGRSFTSVAVARAAVDSSAAALSSPAWRNLPQQERADLMRRLATVALEHAAEFSRLETLATGKLSRATSGEAAHVAETLHYFAGLADGLSGRLMDLTSTTEGKVRYEPLGVVVGITPFNGSLSLGVWKLAPALAMGNTMILKPPADAPGSTLLLAELAIQAGFPAGVFNVVPGGADVASELVDDPRVALVSFTGSTAVARSVGARVVGRLGQFVCETGGKSPQIVFGDADLDRAAAGVAQGIFSNAGQSCVAGSRLLVEAGVADEFLERLAARARSLRVGEMLDPASEMGPLASLRQFDRVTGMIRTAVDEGAQVLAGGAPTGTADGFFVQPTVLLDPDRSTSGWRDEFFGPVITATTFETEDEAVARANDSEFGLAAGVWTRDLARAHRMSRRIEAGSIWINTYRYMDYRLPFGGYKQSGIGRENGVEALHHYQAIKAIVIEHPELEAEGVLG